MSLAKLSPTKARGEGGRRGALTFAGAETGWARRWPRKELEERESAAMELWSAAMPTVLRDRVLLPALLRPGPRRVEREREIERENSEIG